MKKEDILAKSRNEKKDEGVEHFMNRGRIFGVAGMIIMFIILVIFNFSKGLNSYSIQAIFWTYIGFESFGKYRVTKEKMLLVSTFAGILAGMIFAITHIVTTG